MVVQIQGRHVGREIRVEREIGAPAADGHHGPERLQPAHVVGTVAAVPAFVAAVIGRPAMAVMRRHARGIIVGRRRTRDAHRHAVQTAVAAPQRQELGVLFEKGGNPRHTGEAAVLGGKAVAVVVQVRPGGRDGVVAVAAAVVAGGRGQQGGGSPCGVTTSGKVVMTATAAAAGGGGAVVAGHVDLTTNDVEPPKKTSREQCRRGCFLRS